MTLTGPATAILIVLAALAVAVVTFLVWSRVPGSPWIRRGLRLLLLVANQFVAVLLVGVLANDAGNFYSSWTDLFAGGGGSAALARPHARSQPAPPAGVLTADDAKFATRSQWPVRGRLISITVSGATSQLHAPAYVYLPPQYFQPSYAKTSFPAIELLTGYGHSAAGLAARGAAPDVMLRLMRSGAVPAVLVMTSAAPGPDRDTECVDVPAGPQAATFLGIDIPMAISHSYRVTPVGWGIGGIGEGGYCAAKLAMLHSDVFYAGALIGAYYAPRRTAKTGDLWAGSAVLSRLDDLGWRLRHLPAPPARLLALDPPGGTADRTFAALVRPPMRMTVQETSPQGDATRNALPVALNWLSANLPRPG